MAFCVKKHSDSSLAMPVLVLWSNTNKGQLRKDLVFFCIFITNKNSDSETSSILGHKNLTLTVSNTASLHSLTVWYEKSVMYKMV